MVTQVAATQFLDKLRAELAAKFPAQKVNEVLFHYQMLRTKFRLDDYESCLVNAGKFVEAVLKCLRYKRTGDEVDALKVDTEINQLEGATSLNESERMTIPRTLRIIYEHRNKRGGAHNSSFDPIRMDSTLVVAAASWVMEELTRLYLTNDPVAAQALVANLMIKELPFVEEIDGDYLVLPPGSARVHLEFILYIRYPSRCSLDDLVRWLHTHKANNIRTTLRDMRQRNLVHKTEDGWILTEAGIREAEKEIALIQNNQARVNSTRKVLTRGARNGRH